MDENNDLIIPAPLAQNILNYLAKQPYGEVAVLVGGLLQLKPALSTEPKDAELERSSVSD